MINIIDSKELLSICEIERKNSNGEFLPIEGYLYATCDLGEIELLYDEADKLEENEVETILNFAELKRRMEGYTVV